MKVTVSLVLFLLLAAVPAAAYTTWTGETGLFTIQTAWTNEYHQWKFGAVFNNFERVLVQDDPAYQSEKDIDIDYLTFPVSFGILPWWEISASAGFTALRDGGPKTPRIWRQGFWDGGEIDEKGVGDIRLNTKFRVLHIEGFGISLGSFLNIGTADETRGLGTGKTDVGFMAAASGDIGGVMGAHINLGYRINDNVEDGPIPVNYHDQLLYGIGLDFHLPVRGIDLIVELLGEEQKDPRLPDDPLDITAGVRIPLNDSWAVNSALRYAIGETTGSCMWGGMFGFVYKSPGVVRAMGLPSPPPKKKATGVPYYDPCAGAIKVKVPKEEPPPVPEPPPPVEEETFGVMSVEPPPCEPCEKEEPPCDPCGEKIKIEIPRGETVKFETNPRESEEQEKKGD